MIAIARFVIRPDEPGRSRLLIGLEFPKHSPLKPNTVYQVEEILGELIIQEKGPAAICTGPKDTGYAPWADWNHSVEQVIEYSQGKYLYTRQEWLKETGLSPAPEKP